MKASTESVSDYQKRMDSVLVVACRPWWGEQAAGAAWELLNRLFKRLSQLAWVDDFVLWTRVPEIVSLATRHGFHFIAQKADMRNVPVYADGIPQPWKDELSKALKKLRGTAGNVQAYLDADHILFNCETLERMFDRLMEQEAAHQVVAAYPIDPHLYLDTKSGLRQIYDAEGMDRQVIPQLYRRCAIIMRHALRPQAGAVREILHQVSWEEGFAFRPEYEDFFLEASKRSIGRETPP